MKASKARKLTIKYNTKYRKAIDELNELIEKECKKGNTQMNFYKYDITLKTLRLTDESYNFLLDYLRRNGFKVVQDEHCNTISW